MNQVKKTSITRQLLKKLSFINGECEKVICFSHDYLRIRKWELKFRPNQKMENEYGARCLNNTPGFVRKDGGRDMRGDVWKR